MARAAISKIVLQVRASMFHDGHTSAPITTSARNPAHSSLARCFAVNVILMEKHRASCRLNYTRWLLPAPRYDIVELSLTDILMIRPQYQKIVRRIVAHLLTLSDSGRSESSQ